MKKLRQIAIALIVSIMASLAANAQLVVKPNGRIQMGNYLFEDQQMPNVNPPEKRDTVTLVKLFGYNPEGAGARLSFGDQFSRWSNNVVIGELSRHNDTDRLWLHGKCGLYFTSHSTGDTIYYYDISKGADFHFNTDVVADGFLLGSDKRYKHDIRAIERGIDDLSRLNAVSYKLYPHFTQENADKYWAEAGDEADPTGKLAKDRETFKKFYAELADQPTRYGFIAQEVEEVMPELVHTDKNGYKSVDYIGVIPILVNAVQELRAELAELKGETAPKSPSHAPQQTAGTDGLAAALNKPTLYQNIPNPFNSDTHIRLCLPESVHQADLFIYDLQGHQVRRLEVVQRGETSVTVNASELPAGMYIYTLIADGQEIDSKRMILTK